MKKIDLIKGIIAQGPQLITEVTLLEGPWGIASKEPNEYFQECRDYAGHHTCRKNVITALGKLHRALRTSGRLKSVLNEVKAQLDGCHFWNANIGLFYEVEPKTFWKHERVQRLETRRELMDRAFYSATRT